MGVTRTWWLGGLALVIGAGAAQAGGMPLGTQHDPPRFLDESRTYMTIGGQGDGYVFQLHTLLFGYASASDQLRLDWRQGGKLLASAKCVPESGSTVRFAEVHCDQRAKTLKAKGAIEAELIYKDDQDDKDYLVRTFKVTVVEWAKGTWQLAADDLLGAAYAVDHRHQSTAQDPHPRFRFWIANGTLGRGNGSLRCTAGGKPLPELPVSVSSTTRLDASILPPRGEEIAWKWATYEIEADTAQDGPKDPRQDEQVWLVDHPGDWDCLFRVDGRNLRELLFRVGANGMIASHPMQEAAGAAPLAPGISLIDIRIPRDAAIDQRIKPDQLRTSRGFGLPWPNHPSVKAIHAGFPPAFENAKPAPQKRAVGKVLPGAAHTPPRFIDEARVEMNLNRKWENKVDGYGFTMRTEIGAAIGKADRVRLDWKQGRKLLASARCELDAYDDQYGNVRCEYADKPLTAKGAIKADLVYSDDVDGNDYLLRTFKLVVAKYPSFGDAVWQLVPDDLLGAAWVEHNYPQQLNDATRGHPHFIFWVANKLPGDGALRCTVAGSKIPDIKLAMDVAGNINIGATTSSRNGKRLEYRWTHVDATADIYFGKRADYKGASDQMAFLAEHPGAWDCQVRSEGTAIRQLLFTVGNDGLITSDLQTARGAALTAENVSAIDLRFPRGVKFDERVRPGAMKTSRGFGLPWPDARSVKASQATFPPASGLPDPK